MGRFLLASRREVDRDPRGVGLRASLLRGIRYLLLDLHIGIAKAPSRASAVVVLALGFLAALAFAWCIW
jgi:hypothetical protein